jgi:sugar/nucleoside kinase (ribokinase family)
MSLLVVGSVAIDNVETPGGHSAGELGGSAVYFSFAARSFGPVRIVGIVGEDFPAEYERRLAARLGHLSGLQRVPGETFRWHGAYAGRMEQAETLDVQLNVFGDFEPTIPTAYCDSRYVFLANGSPVTHMHALNQMTAPQFVMADTMNFYIANERDDLMALLQRIDTLVVNDAESLQLSAAPDLITAGRWICAHGPSTCIIKKGEHGALLFNDGTIFTLPALPCERVVDPTGAGDSFAGGVMGYLADRCGGDAPDDDALRHALAYGTVAASFALEGFGPWVFETMQRADIDRRMAQFVESTQLRAPAS